jgi:preprotein translocase subunit SecE
MFAKIRKFFDEVVQELQKVAWPSKDELIGSTMVVIAMTLVLSVFIGIVDFALKEIINTLVKITG